MCCIEEFFECDVNYFKEWVIVSIIMWVKFLLFDGEGFFLGMFICDICSIDDME